MNIKINNLIKIYPDGYRALNGLNLEIKPGIFGLLGPNGACKTTLMRIMTLLQSSSSGSILFDDCDILHHRKEIRSVLGYLPQDFRFFEKLKTWEFLDYGAGLAGIRGKRKRAEVVDELLRKVGLYEVRDRWANRLSGGMKRRLGIAQAIVGNPKVIIVDEPTTELENRTFNCNDSGLVCMVLGDSLRTGKRRRNSAEVRGYAMKGKVYPGEAEWLESWAKVPLDEWLELMKQRNPEKFDAKEWVRRFKAARFRYIKITTKQHEGFCLWPSEYSPYNVACTPYGKDILVELVQACGEEGMDIHFYFSVMDWSHPDWRYDIRSREDSIAFRRFLAFMDNQLKELAKRKGLLVRRDMGQQHKEKCLMDGTCRADAERAGPGGDGK